jgi:hypothetical protein
MKTINLKTALHLLLICLMLLTSVYAGKKMYREMKNVCLTQSQPSTQLFFELLK